MQSDRFYHFLHIYTGIGQPFDFQQDASFENASDDGKAFYFYHGTKSDFWSFSSPDLLLFQKKQPLHSFSNLSTEISNSSNESEEA
jgi:hypothetical protein